MNTIAADFSAEMGRVRLFLDAIASAFNLAKIDRSRFRSKHPLGNAAKDVHSKARLALLGEPLAYEGAFLSVCAMFEECVRDLIDECAIQCVSKRSTFPALPPQMVDAHLEGCINILQSRSHAKFSHLPPELVVARMSTCHTASPTTGYLIVPEALSSNTNNFSSKILAATIKKVGVNNVWPRLRQEAALGAYYPGVGFATVETYAVAALDALMRKRNSIVHRSTSFASPTELEVRNATLFAAALIAAVASLLTSHVASL